MKNKNYIWIIEVKTSNSKKYIPYTGVFKNTWMAGIYNSRGLARNAARYMQENNQYNFPVVMIKYRVAKYKKL